MDFASMVSLLPWVALVGGIACFILSLLFYNNAIGRSGKPPFSMPIAAVAYVVFVVIGFPVALFLPDLTMGFAAGGGLTGVAVVFIVCFWLWIIGR